MRNRYGDGYVFERIGDNQYAIKGELKFWRFGGREGQREMDLTDLGFVDPSGGPFISVGSKIEGREIVRISAEGNLEGTPNILFTVKDE